MLQTFSLNLLFDNARFYLTPLSGTTLGSRSNSYESLRDPSDMSPPTPSSSPRTSGPETLPSQATSTSLALPIATPAGVQPSLSLLPFPQSQASLAPRPDPATPSLLDTSISFARMMDRTGSPASFLTCSSGWDPGFVCGAAKFPSLLHSGRSIDDFCLQETHCVPSDSNVGVECRLREGRPPLTSQSPPKLSFSVAAPFYFSPSSRDGEFTRLQASDLDTSTPPHSALEFQLPSQANRKHQPTSPQTTSPGSEFSLEESTTSSIYHSPFHWDTILADLPPSPQYSPVLSAATGEPQPARILTPTSPNPPHTQRSETLIVPLACDLTFSSASQTPIPTIVVLDPDSVMVPAQASVSSIIGLYDNRYECTQPLTGGFPDLQPQTPKGIPGVDLDQSDTDGEGSNSESDFEIIAVPALKVRLDDLSETDEIDAGNAFGSLMTTESIASVNHRKQATGEETSEFPENERNFSSCSSMAEPSIDVSSAFPTSLIDPKVSASNSFASTAKLRYAQSGTSISGQSTRSSWNPTPSGSESDCPWLFCVEDGKVFKVPRNPSVHGGGKLFEKLARFPDVPKSPCLTPPPSPFASPPPSPLPANQRFLDASFPSGTHKKPNETTVLDDVYAGSLLSPRWERNAAGCTTVFSPGTSTLYQPTTAVESSEVAGISFAELDVDLGLSSDFGSLTSDYPPTDSSSSSGYSTKLSTAQSATHSCGRHVRFESADLKTDSITTGSKRHLPHHRRPLLNRSKTCLKKKSWRDNAQDKKGPSDVPHTLVRSPGADFDHLSSSFSSGSISKKGSWRRSGRLLVVVERVRRGIGGCLSSRDEETFGGTVAQWATEHEYWNDHMVTGKPERSSDQTRSSKLLGRIR